MPLVIRAFSPLPTLYVWIARPDDVLPTPDTEFEELERKDSRDTKMGNKKPGPQLARLSLLAVLVLAGTANRTSAQNLPPAPPTVASATPAPVPLTMQQAVDLALARN